MTEDHLADREKHTLGGEVFGHVHRPLIYEGCFKVNPHWMGGVCHTPVGECVGHQQVAELIARDGLRNRLERQQCCAQDKRCDSDQDD